MARYLDRIVARFKRQEQKGISKYGQILEDNPRGVPEALEYLAEELTDGLMYVEEAIEKAGQTDYRTLLAETELRASRAEAEVEHLIKLCLKEISFDKEQLNIKLGGSGAMLFIDFIVELFKANGGENYLTFGVEGNGHRYAITIQNSDGILTPAEKIGELEEENAALTEANDLQRQSIQNLSAQVAALREALNDVYPMIAGRVIQLIDAGEEWVAGQWDKEAKKVLAVLEGVEENE